jgi:hypothetical protein
MKNGRKKIAMIISVVFLFVAGGSTGAYAYYKTPVSYLSLDSNPSVELGVNAFGEVVKAESYNVDGEKILNGIEVTGLNVKEAVKNLIESVADNGYIADDGSTIISLTAETNNINRGMNIENDAECGADAALQNTYRNAYIQTDNVSLSMNEEARVLGITPGKLNLIKKIQSLDPTVTVEQYKDSSVKNIMKTIKDNREQSLVSNRNEKAEDNNDKGIVKKSDESNISKNGKEQRENMNISKGKNTKLMVTENVDDVDN